MNNSKQHELDYQSMPRLMRLDEAAKYTRLGRHTLRKFAESAGAIIRFGGAIRVDRVALDRALDAQKQDT